MIAHGLDALIAVSCRHIDGIVDLQVLLLDDSSSSFDNRRCGFLIASRTYPCSGQIRNREESR
jgi:hypothetical protein